MTTAIYAPDTDRLQPKAAGHAVSVGALLSIIEWLSGDECHALDEAGLVSGLGRRLQALGLPVDRLTLHLMTLHPEFIGRTIAWAPGEPVEIHDREHGARVAISNTPLRKVMETREPLVVDTGESVHGRWQHIDVFADRGLMQLVIAPLCNVDGPVSAAVFGTRRPGGFTAPERQVIERILPALRNTSELRILRQVELSLLDTYIGPLTASRILAGRIRRDEIESIEAALLLCDLRGFTELSNRLPGSTMLGLLNAYFDRIVPAITRQGGEVLKFMGDAVLAFFPGYDAAHSCGAALASARAILEEIDHFQYEGIGVKAGIALHYGEVSYGNVGSGRRLDFTLIGGDVNLVSRIQTACSELGEALLMSAPFRDEAGAGDVVSVGAHRLKGFADPVELFTIMR
ncbi:adenylate/guanylate cyclase domain-containing protein [Rhizobium ruizarguesonis]|uniref:adenylate/guanylate cyclase domain-containing protein n=1 Tax=Rhizobium ruizarguesonis TaxID=2081791 RepID=UPI00102FBE53|nr:adenylate/guanylate cyclase domain-containing protein [Rhizobium ruizarguesonis]QIJ39639.1 adenylate/guanylate cyclase domain-containing protein [Rhizobium leguminosarum]NEH32232.1 adenylate/guanylate cyclase domain-containing protein [Rhizobium ruizarguesonis]NEJ09814.1 adenylate/guanylate cyclase domain-containing protein [Rhizobium ruizarguesonis]NEK12369.1 adenylate/guanylate cyclase domain-containing protein [Rhizobium ruizarguesonis]TAU09217.1 adenylate/guanylate cyclase domain-contai